MYARFNEAGAIRPRKAGAAVFGQVHHVHASMRPGRLGPGRVVLIGLTADDFGASMRPGRLGPGRGFKGKHRSGWWLLQ